MEQYLPFAQVGTFFAYTIRIDTLGRNGKIMDDSDARLVAQTLDILGGKWKVLILWHLGVAGVCRFGELQRRLPGVTQRTLTLQLRELEAAGLVHRTVYAEVPPRTEYRQTDEAKDLAAVYMELKRWSLAHRELLKRQA
jgi:DNA-binding HxlR family transcriptional regulator